MYLDLADCYYFQSEEVTKTISKEVRNPTCDTSPPRPQTRGFSLHKFPEDLEAVMELKKKQLNMEGKNLTQVRAGTRALEPANKTYSHRNTSPQR